MADEHVKIHVTLEPGYTYEGETLWAIRVGDGPAPKQGLYKVDNIPFVAETIGFGDIVLCDESNPMKIPEYLSVHVARAAKGGIIVFSDGTPDSIQLAIIAELRDAGAGIERAEGTVWVFDVEAANIRAVEVILDARNQLGQLRFEYNKV